MILEVKIMVNTKQMFDASTTCTERAQVIPLPSDSGIRTPNKDINQEYIAAAAAIGRAGARARTRVYAGAELAE